VKPFADRLASDPHDAEANDRLGKYLCLLKGKWERGLPHLARSDDARWKALAQRDLGDPKETKKQVELGDAWAKLAEAEKDVPKRNLLRRSLHWYVKALPKLDGLTRVRVEKAVEEVGKLFPAAYVAAADIAAETRRFDLGPGGGGVQCLAVSRDGRYLLSAGTTDRTVRLWDVQAGKQMRQFVGHAAGIQCVAISPDGTYGASGCTAMTLRLWDLKGGNQIRQFVGHTDFVRGVFFLPDGKRLLSAADDKTLRIWDVATGNEQKRLAGHTNYINGLAVSKDGKLALSGSQDNTARVWDLVKMEQARQLAHPHYVWAVALSPDGKTAVTACWDRSVRVWDVGAGKELRRLEHPSMVWSIAFSPDGRRVVTGSGNQADVKKDGGFFPAPATETYVHLWDVGSGKELRRLKGHTGVVRTVAFAPDGRWVASGSDDGTIRIWGPGK
jgi:WD40 repeat protein